MLSTKSPRVWRFVEEASKPTCKNATQAALAAGYSHNAITETATRLMADPNVVAEIMERRTKRAEQLDITPMLVLQRWLDVATADPTKIIRTRRLCCRYCHGAAHGYQWTEWEFAEKAAEAMDHGESLPDIGGGMGFRFNEDPHPDCPRCMGEGLADVYVCDMSTLTGPERALVASVKQTKEGVEVKMHDQAAAWDNIARFLGMIVNKSELTGKDGRPLMPGMKPVDVIDIPTDHKVLEVYYRDIVKGS